AASQNMLIFLGASPGLPRAAVHRVAVRARALLPLLKAEALRISVADPKSLFEKRITEYDKEMAENDKNMLETDSTLSLAELMLALGEYKKAKGTSPARLEEVAPAYIKEIPVWVSRHHSASYKVINYSGSAKKAGEAVTDAGGWLYFNSPESKFYGQVFPNCSHKDQNGKPTYALGGPSSDGPLAGKVTVH
ncbi:MAG: hypothetical protein NTY45_07005, partial [Elusimicrobia bacterium]|nr:hypothetical protein [Elusimicrobiota bacterium]